MKRIAAVLCVPVIFCSGAPAAAAAEIDVVGRIDSVVLSAGDMRSALDALGAEGGELIRQSPPALEQAVRHELLRRLLLMKAKAAGTDTRTDVRLRAERARDDAVISAFVNDIARTPRGFPADEEIRAAYDANRAAFTRLPQYRLAQIFIAVAAPNEASARKKAEEAALAARKAPADFAALAGRLSEHAATAAQGGEAGWLPEDQLLPEIRGEAVRLEPGAVAGPIRSAQGWHVIKLLEKRPATQQSLDEVRQSIVASLRLQRAQQNERKYLEELLTATPPRLDAAGLQRLQTAPR